MIMNDHHQQGLGMIRRHLNVSRETEDRLVAYVELLAKWQSKINLISGKTLDDVWTRHILDVAQIYPFVSRATAKIMDIGSGAGLPGLIIAILRAGDYGARAHPVIMVESDQRKGAFLAAAARECDVSIKIENKRLELLPAQSPDVITARALASVEKLLRLTRIQHHDNLTCVFLKGARVDEELTCLSDYPNIKVEKRPSLTSDDGVILILSGFHG
jgi:16S rRNA (guanine527-N7)-methyltransferase